MKKENICELEIRIKNREQFLQDEEGLCDYVETFYILNLVKKVKKDFVDFPFVPPYVVEDKLGKEFSEALRKNIQAKIKWLSDKK